MATYIKNIENGNVVWGSNADTKKDFIVISDGKCSKVLAGISSGPKYSEIIEAASDLAIDQELPKKSTKKLTLKFA